MAERTLIPITGAQYEISAGDYRAVITQQGAGLREFKYQGEPAITGYDAGQVAPSGSGQLLLPWPNRVDGGRYTFAGASHQLDLSEPARGNAIHGLTRWVSWAADAQAPDLIQLTLLLAGSPGYPFCLELTARYQVAAAEGLTVTVIARNSGDQAAPYGTGSHPYLTAGAATVDDCALALPADSWLAADERGIPDGPPHDVSGTDYDFRAGRPIGAIKLDHAFTGLSRGSDGRAWARLTGARRTVSLWAGDGYDWLQVFSGDALIPERRRKALAIEPMTCPPNSFVSGEGLLALDPGESVARSWGIQVSRD
jgi:aldose 1-epimerase